MARVFKVGDRWWTDFRANGRRHRESVGAGASFRLAKETLAKRMHEIAERQQFRNRTANETPFEVVADEFERLHIATLLSGSWRQMFPEVRERFKGRKIGEITTADIQRFYNEVQARASASTANRFLTLSRLFFNKAKAWGYSIGLDNPCVAVKKQREPKHRLRFLSKDEIAALYAGSDSRLYPFALAAIHTGMRKGELLGLFWENVSLERSTIYVLKTKSGEARTIPITGELSRVLEGIGPRPKGSVFGLSDGELRKSFENAREAARLPSEGPDKVTLHTLRHSFASQFMLQGGNIYTLQKLLGHSSLALTQRYAHLSQGHLASEMALFEAGLAVKRPLVVAAIPEAIRASLEAQPA